MTNAKKRPSPTTCNEPTMDEDQGRYRDHLVAARQTSQSEWDKATWLLASGTIATSLVFLKDIVGTKLILQREWLIRGWACLVLSLALVLLSHSLSMGSLSRAIDAGDEHRLAPHKNCLRCATTCCNVIASALCILGVSGVLWFAYLNFGA